MIAVRSVERTDETEWRPLWRGYLAFYATELPEAIYRTTFDRLTDPGVSDYRGLLAIRDDEPVGLAHYVFHRHGWQVENVTYLQDLFVAEAARGTGAGRALIEMVYAAADAAGAPKVYWLTQDSNITARRLYDRIGTATPFVKYVR
jgi:GNAT superfamily N-acetyltransferase